MEVPPLLRTSDFDQRRDWIKERCDIDALAILQRLGSGQLLDDLRDALVATAEEVVATGNAGKVVLTITLTTKRQGDILIMVDESISRTVPKVEPKGAFFYAANGDLWRDDPRQVPIDFRAVDTATGEIRNVLTDHAERSAGT